MDTSIEYGCLMAYVNIPGWNNLNNYLLPHEVEDDGFEDKPHVTVLYGFDIQRKSLDNNIKRSLELLDIHKFPIYLTGIGVFENDGRDVLKFNVKSELLTKLNNFYKTVFPNVELYDEYNPHITIAYMLGGTGRKYTFDFNKPIVLYPDKFVYSEKEDDFQSITHKIK